MAAGGGRSSRAARAAAATLGSILLTLLLAEIGLRVGAPSLEWMLRPISDMMEPTGRDQPPYFGLRPDEVVEYPGFGGGGPTTVAINAMGFRDRERGRARRSGVARVIAVGDSFTFGLGVMQDATVTARLEPLLARAGEPPVEVWNLGVPGYSTVDELAVVRETALPLDPDVLVLQVCDNDAVSPPRVGPRVLWLVRHSALARLCFAIRVSLGGDVEGFRRALEAILDQAAARRVPVVVWSVGFPFGTDQWVRDLLRARGIPLLYLAFNSTRHPRLAHEGHLSALGTEHLAEDLVAPVRAGVARRRIVPTDVAPALGLSDGGSSDTHVGRYCFGY